MAAPEILEDDRRAPSPLRTWWRGQPPRRRRWTSAVLALVVTAGVLAVAASYGRAWLHERRLADTVTLTATMGVAAASSSPAGGSVNYFLRIRNVGPRPLDVEALSAAAPGLRVAGRGRVLPRRLERGDTLLVPVSARLDCRGRPPPRTDPPADDLVAAVIARPESERQHRVRLPVRGGALLSGSADTLCSVRPDLHDRELSGPVLAPA